MPQEQSREGEEPVAPGEVAPAPGAAPVAQEGLRRDKEEEQEEGAAKKGRRHLENSARRNLVQSPIPKALKQL